MTVPARIVVTRPRPGLDRTLDWIAAAGHQAIGCPLTRIEPLNGGSVRFDPAVQGLVVSSANAFRFLDPEAARHLQHLPLWLVGERTAAAARSAGFGAIQAVVPDAQALEQHFAALRPHGRPLGYLAGRVRSPAVEQLSRAHGVRLQVADIYDTMADDDGCAALLGAFTLGLPDAVMFHAARSVEVAFDTLVGRVDENVLLRCRYIMISGRLLACVPKHLRPACRVAASPNEPGMQAALAQVISPFD